MLITIIHRVAYVYAMVRHRLLRRLYNRLKPLFRLSEIWNWEYESCNRCGCCFKFMYMLRDDTWIKLYGSDGGCLCLNCAVEKALEKGIIIKRSDIEQLSLFYGDIVAGDELISDNFLAQEEK